jgi:hypothetical protein
MATERRKKKKRKPKSAAGEATMSSPSSHHIGVDPNAPAQSGGVLQSLRSGFRRAAGAEQAKESTLSKVIWGLILGGVLIFVIGRYLGLWGTEEAPRESDPEPRTPTKVEQPAEPAAEEPAAEEPAAQEPAAEEPAAEEPAAEEPEREPSDSE